MATFHDGPVLQEELEHVAEAILRCDHQGSRPAVPGLIRVGPVVQQELRHVDEALG